MSTFIHLSGAKVTINLDQVAYVEDVTAWAIDDNEREEVRRRITVVFAAAVTAPLAEYWGEPIRLSLTLQNDDAEQFMAGLMRRAETW